MVFRHIAHHIVGEAPGGGAGLVPGGDGDADGRKRNVMMF